jgi:DNA-damage-inducible protein D
MEQNSKIILFEDKQIRRAWESEQWYFSVVDIIGLLTDSKDPQQYWKRLNLRDTEIKGAVQVVPILFDTAGGKQKVLCSNTEGVFRMIMSIPSAKAEPFKQWLAQVGKERLDEIQDPELLSDRQIQLYRAKGYTDEWIERRIEATNARKRLTSEWKNRGVTESKDFSILTAIIAKGTFGVMPSEHGKIKGLERENLRDHMTPLELIFTALGEETTRLLSIRNDSQGFNENLDTAIEGGTKTGQARSNYEKNTGLKVISPENYLNQIEKAEQKNVLPLNDK